MTLPVAAPELTPTVCWTAPTPPGLVVTTMYCVPVAPGAADRGNAVMIFAGRVPETLGFGEAMTIVCFPVLLTAICGTVPGLATPITPGGRLFIIVAPLGRAIPD